MVSQAELDAVLANYWPTSPWLQMTNAAGLGGTNVTFALTNSTAGAFSVDDTELGLISGVGSLAIGRAGGTGAVDVDITEFAKVQKKLIYFGQQYWYRGKYGEVQKNQKVFLTRFLPRISSKKPYMPSTSHSTKFCIPAGTS